MIHGARQLAEADDEAGDVRVCGIFVVAIVIGTAWFYQHVLCFSMQLVH